MRARGFLACIVFVLISLVAASCTTGVSQEEYDRVSSELARTQEELAAAKGNLSETEAMLAQAQSELNALKATPAILEVVFRPCWNSETDLSQSNQGSLRGGDLGG